MYSQILLASKVGRDHRDWEIEAASLGRRSNESRSSIRRSIGRRVIALGQQIAAEQPLELAGSR